MPPKKPVLEAMTDQMWLSVNHLEHTDTNFKGIVDDCMRQIPITLGSFSVVRLPRDTNVYAPTVIIKCLVYSRV